MLDTINIIKNTTNIIKVSFERYKNGYIATSSSMKGLFVSHNKLSNVYDNVPTAIKLIFKAKYGIDVNVEEAPDFAEEKHDLKDVVFLAKAA